MHYNYTSKDVARFWSKVDIRGKDDCWLWKGARTGKRENPYGHMVWGRTTQKAHRIAYEITFGSCPPNLDICHKCDTPLCCNPSHLFPGTAKENILDMMNKGRLPDRRGEKSPAHKLSDQQVSEIRSRYSAGEKQKALAKIYGICKNHVWNIVHHKNRS